MQPVGYLPEARDDIDSTYHGYERRLAGLGDRFLDALRRSVGLLAANPGLYGEVAPGVRAAPLRRLPHVVYYQDQPQQVPVVAVRHGRDDPAIWQGRV